MGIKGLIKKSVAMLSAVAMAFSMTVIPTGSVFAEESTEENPLQLRKSAELQDDGTYKITLEAWAKGEVTVETHDARNSRFGDRHLRRDMLLDDSGQITEDGPSLVKYLDETTTTTFIIEVKLETVNERIELGELLSRCGRQRAVTHI